MQVKTYSGASSQEVLAQIKAEMGPDAVILSNRTYRKDGVLCHEVTAGLERNPVSGSIVPGAEVPSGWGEWHREWMQIKDQLFALMKPAIQMERLSPRQRVALEYLQREGISDAVAIELYKRLVSGSGSSVLECLGGMVPVRAWGLEEWGQKLQFLTGPFGMGKTSTALRFALQVRQQDPEARIAFINCDCLRGNGRLVLRHWAELSNFAYLEAPDKSAMEHALQAAGRAHVIFVDVPGFSHGQDLSTWLDKMGLGRADAAAHLLLSPFCDALQTKAFLQRYHYDGAGSIVWGKLDEAVSFGHMVNVAYATGLPVSALSFGSELKESLVPATEPLIWRLIFKRQLPAQTV